MSDAPLWSPPPPQPSPRGPNVAGIAVLALLVGAIGGAATGGYVATTRLAPPSEGTIVATSTTAPGPIPSAPPVTAANGASDVGGVVNELLPSVVTVFYWPPSGPYQVIVDR